MNIIKLIKPLLCLSLLAIASCAVKENKRTNEEIFFADPTIYVEGGKYYLTGTKNREPLGFAMLESKDLKNWKTPGADSLYMILKREDTYAGDKGIWAPQILKEDGDYYMTYTSNEQTCIAKAKSLWGPYKMSSNNPIDLSEKNIDSYLFKDDNGTYYLYHVRFNKGNYLWVSEYDFETGKIKHNTLSKVFNKTQDWEDTPNYESNPIMEGPTVIKMNDKYYLFYSANHFRNIDYGVGYATSDSPYGPWVKNTENPIIHRTIVGENGSGHGDIFKGLDDKLYYVYHTHNSDSTVVPRRTRIVPLNLKWNSSKKMYDITADKDNVIIPKIMR